MSSDTILDEFLGEICAGRYKIVRKIARGGMGAIFEGRDLEQDRSVAIKVVDPLWLSEQSVLSRFQREIRAQLAFRSPHAVEIFDTGMHEGVPYYVMELLVGEDLGKRLSRLGRLDIEETLQVAEAVLEGLVDAHRAGIVHRDLKPDNIFLTERPDGTKEIKILDLGISKMTRTSNGTLLTPLTARGVVVGTPLYLSPEQALARTDLDGRADLYSLGAVLFECLAGRTPFQGGNEGQIMLQIATVDAPSLSQFVPALRPELVRWVDKALRRRRSRRFRSAAEMLAALPGARGDVGFRAKAALLAMAPTLGLGLGVGVLVAAIAIVAARCT